LNKSTNIHKGGIMNASDVRRKNLCYYPEWTEKK